MSAHASRSAAPLSTCSHRSFTCRIGRLTLVAAATASGLALVFPAATYAQQDTMQPDVENAAHQFQGVLTRPEFVRSGPGSNFYATQRLEIGATVVVVGARGDWLKIVPPEGSFSYVSKAWVQAYGDGKQGKVTSLQLMVRAGSSLQPNKWVTQTKLEPKDSVQILGEEGEYFKIKPPTGAYLFLPKDAVEAKARVEPVKTDVPAAAPATPPAPVSPPAPATPPLVHLPPAPGPTTPSSGSPQPTTPASGGPVVTVTPAAPPTTAPSASSAVPAGITGDGKNSSVAAPDEATASEAPLAKPLTPAEAIDRLQGLEQQFAAVSQKPLADQPLKELQSDYEQVGATQGLSEMAKRVVDVRLATLKVRMDARTQLVSAEKSMQDNQDRLTAQQAEHAEIRDQMEKARMPIYAVVGTLRPSSLQISKTPLYRMTDPQTGRTLAYVWATDSTVTRNDGQFVGVRGSIQTEGRLNFKVVTPSAVEVVDPTAIHTAYAADLMPPSMRPTPTVSVRE